MIVVEVKKDTILVRQASNKDIKEVVYALTSMIPLGKVTSYKVLAKIVGIHPRAIARYMADNDKPIIVPCHRVVMSDGEIGGYSRGGSRIKEKLLRLEGVPVVNGRVPRNYIVSELELLSVKGREVELDIID